MSTEHLQKPLEQLHSELADATSADPHHERLQDLQASTRQVLDQIDQGHPPGVLSSFRDELKGSVIHFEATHPKMTLALINVITALNRIGI